MLLEEDGQCAHPQRDRERERGRDLDAGGWSVDDAGDENLRKDTQEERGKMDLQQQVKNSYTTQKLFNTFQRNTTSVGTKVRARHGRVGSSSHPSSHKHSYAHTE